MNFKRCTALVTALLMLLSLLPGTLAYADTGRTCPNGQHHWHSVDYVEPYGCEEDGFDYQECTECGASRQVTIPAPGHNWVQTSNSATCTEMGIVNYECSRCGEAYEQDAPPLGHSFGGDYVIQPATCTQQGLAGHSCYRCGYEEQWVTPALGHDWGEWQPDKPSTCIELGTEVHTCRRCGATEYRRALAYGDHQWGEWYLVRTPSPEMPGLEERKCQICGLTEQREIPYDPDHPIPGGPTVPPVVATDPAIDFTVVEMNADKSIYYVNDQIQYYYTITNKGDKPFYGEGMWQYLGGYQELPWQQANGTLQPGESTSGYTSYTFTLADALQGHVTVGFGASANIGVYGMLDYIFANPVEFAYDLSMEPNANLLLSGSMPYGSYAEGNTVPIDLRVDVTGNAAVENVTITAEIRIDGPDAQLATQTQTALTWPGSANPDTVLADVYNYVVDLLGVTLKDDEQALVTLHFIAKGTVAGTGREVTSNPWATEFNVKKGGPDTEGKPVLVLTVTQNAPDPSKGDYDNPYSAAEISQTFYYTASITNVGTAPCYVTGILSWINGDRMENLFPYLPHLLLPGGSIDNIPISRALDVSYLAPANIVPEIAEKLMGQIMNVLSVTADKAVPDPADGYRHTGEWICYSNNEGFLYFVGKENPDGGYALHLEVTQKDPAWKDPYTAAEMENTFTYSATVTNIGSEPVYLTGFSLLTNGGNDDVFAHDNMPWVILPGDSISTDIWREIGTGSILPGTETETLLGETIVGFTAQGSKAVPNLGPGEAAFENTGEFACVSNQVDITYHVEKPRDPEGVHPELTLSYSGPSGFYQINDMIMTKLTATNTGDVALTPTLFNYGAMPNAANDDGTDFQYYQGKTYQPGESFDMYYAICVTQPDVDDSIILRHCWIDYTYQDVTGAEFADLSNVVNPQFLLNGQEIDASLLLQYVAGSGDGKTLGDYIDIALYITNTGNVPLRITKLSRGGQSGAKSGGDDYSEFYGKGIEGKVLNPGEQCDMGYYAHVLQEEIDDMEVWRLITFYGAYAVPEGEVEIESNTVNPVIPLTDILIPPVTPPDEGAPKLHLEVTPDDPVWKDPYQLDDLDKFFSYYVVVTNVGNAPCLYKHINAQKNGLGYSTTDDDIILLPGEQCDFYCGWLLSASDIVPGTATETLMGEFYTSFQATANKVSITEAGYVGTDEFACDSNVVELTYKIAEPDDWTPPGPKKDADLIVTKEALPSIDPGGFQMNETVYYKIKLTEISEESSLPWITVGDTLAHNDTGDAVIDNINGMAPGTSEMAYYQHVVNENDHDYILNQAYAEWEDEKTGKTITVWSNPVVVPLLTEPPIIPPVPGLPSITLIKSVISAPKNPPYYQEGELVQFKIEIRNDSLYTVHNLQVFDDLFNDEYVGHRIYVAKDFIPGQVDTAVFYYEVTSGDAALGKITNIATSVGLDDNGLLTTSTSNAVEVLTGQPKDELTIIKEETSTPNNDKYYTEGETIAYTITVVNTGASELEVIVYDSLKEENFGEVGSVEILHPGQIWKFFYAHTVTAQDVSDHYVINYAVGKYTGTYGSGTVTSDPVITPTSGEPFTTGGKINSVPGDSCTLTLRDVGDSSLDYTQHYCAAHANAYRQTEDLLARAYSDAGRLDAWQKAGDLWRNELDALYQTLLGAANGEAKVTILNERLTFLMNLGAYENQLRQIHPDQPALVAQRVTEQLMDHCSELCYLIHNAPAARPDSIITGTYTRTIGAAGAACGRVILGAEGSDVKWRQNLCAEHSETKTVAESMVQNVAAKDLAAAWRRAQALWQTRLNTATNAHYKAASQADQQTIAMCRVSFDQLLNAQKELLRLFYPANPEIAAEIMSNTVMNRTLDLCEEW